jgi:hypothetical protein
MIKFFLIFIQITPPFMAGRRALLFRASAQKIFFDSLFWLKPKCADSGKPCRKTAGKQKILRLHFCVMKIKLNNILLLLIIVTLLCIVSQRNAQYLNDIKLKDKNSFFADSTKKKIKLSYKNPLAAGSLSFLLPGLSLGQIYNEDYTSLAIHFGISAGVFMFAYIAGQNKLYELSFGDVGGGPGKEGKREWIFTLCVLSYLSNWIWSTIDAIHYATMNNRELERQRKTGYNNIRLNFAPGIGRNNKPNLNISVYF